MKELSKIIKRFKIGDYVHLDPQYCTHPDYMDRLTIFQIIDIIDIRHQYEIAITPVGQDKYRPNKIEMWVVPKELKRLSDAQRSLVELLYE